MSDYSASQHLRFVIIDLDKTKNYPMNFVCLLPKWLGHNHATIFEKIFGDQSFKVAKKLLTDALKSEDDIEIRKEIEKRLTFLDRK